MDPAIFQLAGFLAWNTLWKDFNTSLLCLLKEPHIVVVLHLTLAKLGCQPKYLSVKKTQEGNYAISEIHKVNAHLFEQQHLQKSC